MSTPETFERSVLAKCDAFTDFQVWPLRKTLDPNSWLNNFTPSEKPYATALLNGFLYYSKDFLIELICHSIQDLSRYLSPPHDSYTSAYHSWGTTLQNIIFCRITGETPHQTDSGHLMIRYVRQHARVHESQMIEAEVALPLLDASTQKTVIFVDDFVGSGQQFIHTWKRPYPSPNGALSFEAINAKNLGHRFIYIPAVATKYGVGEIATHCAGAFIQPAHILDEQYNWLSPNCPFWPAKLKNSAAQVIEEISNRARIPAGLWKGFHDLGMGIAFDHSTPDANLRIFYWDQNNWNPLIRRS